MAAAALLALAGCGYNAGLVAPDGRDSVGLEIFGNETLEPDVERDLDYQLSRALRDLVTTDIVTPNRAELVVRGRILQYGRRSGQRNKTNQLLESGIGIDVEATLWEPGVAEPVAGPARARAWVSYLLGAAENEREARDRALRNVSEKLILDLFTPVN